ncbi:MAG: hypothetical protein FGM14_04200 [Flavobacteriales bacterium]|nr:hypothetical protein [Flavobacteriales bacterium]
MQRVVIYPKDIMIITGRSERYSRNLLKQIKTSYSKLKHQPLTIDEFSHYMGFDPLKIAQLIK